MLVIHRTVGELVKIGQAWVQISSVRNGKVTLAISAPPSVYVARQELIPDPIPKEFTLTKGRVNR